MSRTALATTSSTWNEERARAFLDAARTQMARGVGTSDRTFDRMAALADPDASSSRARFETALQRAGWSPRRIRKALTEVRDRNNRVVLRAQFTPWTREVVMPIATGACCVLCFAFFGSAGVGVFLTGWVLWRYFR